MEILPTLQTLTPQVLAELAALLSDAELVAQAARQVVLDLQQVRIPDGTANAQDFCTVFQTNNFRAVSAQFRQNSREEVDLFMSSKTSRRRMPKQAG